MIWEFASPNLLNGLRRWCRLFRNLNPSAEPTTAEAFSTIEVFKHLLAEIPRFLEIFLKFCHIDSDSYYILRIYFGGKEITTCLINNQTYCTSKKSILSIEKLNASGNYLQQNAEFLTRVVGSWPNVRTFAVCLQQKSRDVTPEIENRKGKLPVLRTFCHNIHHSDASYFEVADAISGLTKILQITNQAQPQSLILLLTGTGGYVCPSESQAETRNI